MKPRPIPVGIDDFRAVREAGLDYVDKSDLIREIVDRAGVQVLLLPRPRRFGKTLNLSMLRCWFEKQDADLSHLFEDLAIWRAGDAYRAHFQRYPVIHFNFKGSKGPSVSHALDVIRKKIVDLYITHRALLDSGRLGEVAERRYRQILDETADQALYEGALLDLSAYLHAHHGEKVVILIDEYDEPIHAGHVHGYAAEVLDFMRNFLGEALESNPYLHKAVVTGILRVAKENLFSGLNNLAVYSLLARPFDTCFGFTEAEVAALAERHGRGDRMEEIRRWYDGYVFGREVIYNPWSVCSYLERGDEVPMAYWLSTSSNDLVRELLQLYALELHPPDAARQTRCRPGAEGRQTGKEDAGSGALRGPGAAPDRRLRRRAARRGRRPHPPVRCGLRRQGRARALGPGALRSSARPEGGRSEQHPRGVRRVPRHSPGRTERKQGRMAGAELPRHSST